MEVVTGAMTTLLPTLAGLLKEEYDLHKNTKGEIRFLKAKLESMETALLKISEAPLDQPPDLQVKLWAKEVRELSYEIEDSVDKFLVRLDRRAQKNPHSFMGFIHKSIDLMTKAKIRHKIGTEIKDIRSRIMEVSERRDRYMVDSVPSKPARPTIDSLRLSALYKEATELIGMEEKTNDLLKRLTEGEGASKQQLKIVSIVGFGGLGKTTLANVVYQKFKPEFDCGAFVSVSLNPNMDNIFKNMLHQLDKHRYFNINESTWGEAELVSELKDFLLNKSCGPLCVQDVFGSEIIKYLNNMGVLDSPEQLQCIHLTSSIICDVPRWISSLSNLSTLKIQNLQTLRQEHLQVLGNMPSLRDLDIWVPEIAQGRHERFVIDSGYPFGRLAKLKIGSQIMGLKFAQGAMQKLQTFEIILSVQRTWDRFGDLDFGLENLSSLKQVYVGRWYAVSWSKPEPEGVEDAILQALDMNPNKPMLEFVMFKL